MNELLKGLIGAELTLLGVAGPVPPRESAADDSATAPGKAGESSKDDERPAVVFSQHDYRTAAG